MANEIKVTEAINEKINNFSKAGTQLQSFQSRSFPSSGGMPTSLIFVEAAIDFIQAVKKYGALIQRDAGQIRDKVESIRAQDVK